MLFYLIDSLFRKLKRHQIYLKGTFYGCIKTKKAVTNYVTALG